MNIIDLSQLPMPAVVEPLDFESIYQEQLAYFQSSMGDGWTAVLESDPVVKLIELAAYREVMLRGRVNDAARAVMLAYATGSDLDQIGANYQVERLLIDPGDAKAIPPRQPAYEADEDYRRRIQLSFEGYTTAGSEQSYIFHGLSADPEVLDVSAISPGPGAVTVYVLSRIGDGMASEVLLANVAKVLNADEVRPMTDRLTVQSASIVRYSIVATLTVLPGPDASVVRDAAQAAAESYAKAQHVLGQGVTLSGIYAALHQPGVQRVDLSSPSSNLAVAISEASFCESIQLTVAEQSDD